LPARGVRCRYFGPKGTVGAAQRLQPVRQFGESSRTCPPAT
jgi:hypothetical protein